MRLVIFLLLFTFSFATFSQEELANDYFEKGQFDKALAIFQKLEAENQRNSNYKLKILEI